MTRDEKINSCIEGCKEGKIDSQKTLYTLLYRKMLGVAIKYLKNPEESEEIVNDTFMKIFRKIGTYEGRGSFEAWVFVVLRRMILSKLRETKAKKERMGITEMNEFMDPGFHTHYYDSEFLEYVIGKLGEKEKRVLEMYLDGFSHKEISKEIGTSESTSKWHLFTLRKKISEKMKIRN